MSVYNYTSISSSTDTISFWSSSIGSFIDLSLINNGFAFILNIILLFIFCTFNNSSLIVIMSVNFISFILKFYKITK